MLCVRLHLLGDGLQSWDSIFRGQPVHVSAVELDATTDPLLVQVNEDTRLDMRRVTAGLLAKVPELCGKVLLALDMRSPQAGIFLGRRSDVGRD